MIMHQLFEAPQSMRQTLLAGPSVHLFIHYHSNMIDHAHQCSAALSMVSADRMRQFTEQRDSVNRPFAIEVPARVLSVTSPFLCQKIHDNGNQTILNLHMGSILPGYTMEVLDWLVRSLNSRTFTPFIPPSASQGTEDTSEPQGPSIVDPDRWFWLYVYATMRTLGMHEFADTFIPLLTQLIYSNMLATDYASYARCLNYLHSTDEITSVLAQQCFKGAKENIFGQKLTAKHYICLRSEFSYFGELVRRLSADDPQRRNERAAPGLEDKAERQEDMEVKHQSANVRDGLQDIEMGHADEDANMNIDAQDANVKDASRDVNMEDDGQSTNNMSLNNQYMNMGNDQENDNEAVMDIS